MPYERTKVIENRFRKVIALLGRKRLNARQLALELGVSRPTVQRVIAELKRRGYSIRSVHEEHAWSYELLKKPNPPNDEPLV